MSHQQIRPGSVARIAAVLCLALAASALAPPAHAVPACDAGDLDGTYAFVIHGVNPDGLPFGAVGTLTGDGEGNLDGFRISLDNGEYSTADFTCAVAVSPQCLFRGPCVDDGEAIAEVQIDGVLADGGREILLLVSGLPSGAPGAVVTGVAHER